MVVLKLSDKLNFYFESALKNFGFCDHNERKVL